MRSNVLPDVANNPRVLQQYVGMVGSSVYFFEDERQITVQLPSNRIGESCENYFRECCRENKNTIKFLLMSLSAVIFVCLVCWFTSMGRRSTGLGSGVLKGNSTLNDINLTSVAETLGKGVPFNESFYLSRD